MIFSLRLLATLTLALGTSLFAASSASRTEIANAAQPQLASDRDGRVWLVYGTLDEMPAPPTPRAHVHQPHQPQGKSAAVFVRRSDDGGVTFAPAVKVAHVPALMIGMRRGPRIAAHADHVTVTLIADELVAFTSDDVGQTWSEAVQINDVPGCAREGLHDFSVAPNGETFVTWLDLRSGNMELWGASSVDGGRTWSDDVQIYRSPDTAICTCCHPNALFDTEGNLAVMWRNAVGGSRDHWLTTRAPGTATFTPPQKLGEGTWRIDGCPLDGGEIIALGSGKFASVWQRMGEVFFTGVDPREIKIGAGKQPVAITRGEEVTVVWQQGAGLVSATAGSTEPVRKHAEQGRFPAITGSAECGAVILAYEYTGPDGVPAVAVERL